MLLCDEDDQQLLAQPPADVNARREWFNANDKDWIEAQNHLVEQYGVFGEEHRPW